MKLNNIEEVKAGMTIEAIMSSSAPNMKALLEENVNIVNMEPQTYFELELVFIEEVVRLLVAGRSIEQLPYERIQRFGINADRILLEIRYPLSQEDNERVMRSVKLGAWSPDELAGTTVEFVPVKRRGLFGKVMISVVGLAAVAATAAAGYHYYKLRK